MGLQTTSEKRMSLLMSGDIKTTDLQVGRTDIAELWEMFHDVQ